MSDPTPKPVFHSFAEFWPYYVGEHRCPGCRALHYVAATIALVLFARAIVLFDWISLLLIPVVSYGLAWIAHFFIEHNKPATWGYVRWSLMAEYKMFWYWLTGRMTAEITRIYGCRKPAKADPQLTPR